MKQYFFGLAMAALLLGPSLAMADVYTFDADISGFDDQNVFTHSFNLGSLASIDSVSIDLVHTVAADIDFRLISPIDNTFVLSTDNGGGSDLSGEYTFVSIIGPLGGNGTWSYLGQDTTIPAGIYDAEAWIQPFTQWNPGQWTLVLDDDRAGDSGSVGSVSVHYTTAVPEPGSIAILGLTGLAWTIPRRRRRIAV